MLSAVKTRERELARAMRREEGRSIKEIACLLGVSRSSVSHWVKDVELSREQHDALLRRNPAHNRQRVGQAIWSAQCRERRLHWQAEGREMARRGNAFHAAGCMLYWAEGSKSRNQARICNADPEIVRFFAEFLRKFFNLPDEQFRVACYLYADHIDRQREVEYFWLSTLRLPATCLGTSIVNVYSRASKRKRINMLPHGTCRLTVSSTRVVQHIYGAIQGYGGFDRPEWLD
jgi:Homeodomain-like domain